MKKNKTYTFVAEHGDKHAAFTAKVLGFGEDKTSGYPTVTLYCAGDTQPFRYILNGDGTVCDWDFLRNYSAN